MLSNMFKGLFALAMLMGLGNLFKKKDVTSEQQHTPSEDNGPTSVTFTPSSTPPKDIHNNFEFDNEDVEIRSPG